MDHFSKLSWTRTRSWLALLSVATLMAGFACSSSDSRDGVLGDVTAKCALDSDCEPALVCVFERCHVECQENRDCEGGALCVLTEIEGVFACQIDDERHCDTDIDCEGKQVCDSENQCRDACDSTSECAADLLCSPELDACVAPPEDGAGGGGGADGNSTASSTNSSSTTRTTSTGGGETLVFSPEGGDYTASGVDFEVPEGAVSEATEIGVAVVDEAPVPLPDDWKALGEIYAITPHDQEFDEAVTLRLPYEGTGDNLAVGWLDDDEAEWQAVSADFESEENVAILEREGLSYFVVIDQGETSVSWIGCGDRVTDEAEVVSADVTEDTTWSGRLYLTRGVNVTNQAVLTIEPGTELVMALDSYLNVARDSTLVADGTNAAPITLCGERGDAGSWRNLSFASDSASDSSLSHLLVSDAGSDTAALLLERGLPIADVQVRNSGAAGVQAPDFEPGSTRLSVETSQGAAAILTGPGAVSNFPRGGSLTGNEEDLIRLAFGSYAGSSQVVVDVVFHDLGLPYLAEQTIEVLDAATLTLEPGVELQMDQSRGIVIGSPTATATLIADGTEANPITIKGAESEPGYWGALHIEDNATSDSVLRHVTLDGGGYEDTTVQYEDVALQLDAAITVQNVSVTNSGTDGVLAYDFAEGSDTLNVTGAEGRPVRLAGPNAVTNFPMGGSLKGNDEDLASVEFGSWAGSARIAEDVTFHVLGVPYRVEEWLEVEGEAALEFEPGVVLEMAQSTGVLIGAQAGTATLIADATEALPIVLRGALPEPGYWGGLRVEENARSTSVLRHVSIDGAGEDGAALELGADIMIDNVAVTNSGSVGVSALEFGAGGSSLSVTGSVNSPVVLTGPTAATNFPLGGTLSGNGEDVVHLAFGSWSASWPIEVDTTLHDLGIPYVADEALEIRESATLTIAAGVEIQFAPETEINVGTGSLVGGLVAEGTSSSPIVLAGSTPTAGWWNGILVGDNVLLDTVLEYVAVRHAINGIDTSKPISIDNCTFSEVTECGVLHDADDTTDYSQSTFENVTTDVCER